MKFGKFNDLHKKNLSTEETKYLVDLAKAEDHDEDVNFNKEEELSKILIQIKESVHKEEIDEEMNKGLKVLDEFEVAYREFFNTVNAILNSHEQRLISAFYAWEKNLLTVFGVFDVDKKAEIELRRRYESEFLTRLKQRISEVEEEENLKKLNANSKDQKKATATKDNKKGKKTDVNPFAVPPRPIHSYKSLMNFDYLIDSTVSEIIEILIKNIINNRDDDIFNLNSKKDEEVIDENPKSSNKLNSISNEFNKSGKVDKNEKKNEKDKDKKDKDGKVKKDIKGKNVNPEDEPLIPEDVDVLTLYNPFYEFSDKELVSPKMKNGIVALSEQNILSKQYLSEFLEGFKETILSKVKEDFDTINESSKKIDFERREDYLSELDIRLKSIAPRKGKLQVEEYDVRLDQIEKHKEKYAAFEKNIIDRNTKDLLDNTRQRESVINPAFEQYLSIYNKIIKNLEEETTIKGINDKYKKYKSEYYDMLNVLDNSEEVQLKYSTTNPTSLIALTKVFIDGMVHFNKGGTYSTREIKYYSDLLENINNNVIKKQMESLIKQNSESLAQIKATMEDNLKSMDKKFALINELIMARNCIGKVFGAPKRLINDIAINMKMKVNQGIDGVCNLIGNIKNIIDTHDIKNKDYLRKK